MKGHPKYGYLTDSNLSAIKQSMRVRHGLKNELMAETDKKPSLFNDQLMVRHVQVRKKMQHPPPDLQKEILYRPAVLSEADLLSILEVVRKTGNVFEMTPAIFSIHSAEELRNIITCNLNINFAGNTAQDLFYPRGKTRFYLKTGSRDVFIGKCTVWRCSEGIIYTVDSMLKAASCPECKGVLLVFNKSESCFRKVVIQTRSALMRHPNLLSMDEAVDENEWRMTMHGPEDRARRMRLHAMVYNLYRRSDKICPHLNDLEREFFATGI